MGSNRDYYTTKAWYDKIDEVKSRVGTSKCEFCDLRYASECHHRTYQRFGGMEEPEDLMMVCKRCHGWMHGNIRSVLYASGSLAEGTDTGKGLTPEWLQHCEKKRKCEHLKRPGECPQCHEEEVDDGLDDIFCQRHRRERTICESCEGAL